MVYTTRLGGLSAGDYGNLNLGGKSGDEPEAVLSNRIALAEAVQARLSLVSQVHSGVAVDVDDSFVINHPFGFDVSGTHGETDTPHVIERTARSPHNPASPRHVHVLRIEQIGAVLGLLDREVLAGALLFHDRILPAAWLGAFAVIAIAAGQIVGEQAAAGEGHAHSTVDEAFDVEVIGNVGANITHGLQVHLAGQHHTASTKLVEAFAA